MGNDRCNAAAAGHQSIICFTHTLQEKEKRWEPSLIPLYCPHNKRQRNTTHSRSELSNYHNSIAFPRPWRYHFLYRRSNDDLINQISYKLDFIQSPDSDLQSSLFRILKK